MNGFPFLLSAALLVGLLPVSALAETEESAETELNTQEEETEPSYEIMPLAVSGAAGIESFSVSAQVNGTAPWDEDNEPGDTGGNKNLNVKKLRKACKKRIKLRTFLFTENDQKVKYMDKEGILTGLDESDNIKVLKQLSHLVEVEKRKKILASHPYAIWYQESTGRWITSLPDGKGGKIRKKNKDK